MGSMTVLTVSAAPVSLRGYVSTFMVQVDTCVFVGRLSARVRESLWKRVVSIKGVGAATMVVSDDSDQGFQIHTSLSRWEAVDLDGVSLVERYDDNDSTRRGDRYLSDDDDGLLNLEN